MTVAASRPRTARTVATRPQLQVIAGPVRGRSLLPFILLILIIIATGLGLSLYLNTQMSVTSYQIRDTQAELEELRDLEKTLKVTVDELGSPAHLRQAATKIGMEPAPATYMVSIEHHSITKVPEVNGH
ncbi:MAG: hypothetical protein Q4Q03_07030 [Bowdeniella nasicola]|nr:hypothetical protein [Bowdeniella nasicola]